MQDQQHLAKRAVVKARLTNWPVIGLFIITVAIVVFYFDVASWRAAINPEVLKPLMAIASALSLMFYFLAGRDALKFLIAVHVFASLAIFAHMATQQMLLADFAVEVVRRVVVVAVVVCLYLWSRDREASFVKRDRSANA
jgi:hypothetical protein